MDDESLNRLNGIIVTQQRQISALLASERAMMRILVELADVVPVHVSEVFLKYSAYKASSLESVLLELEKTNPWFAAELDKYRPLISPDEPDHPA